MADLIANRFGYPASRNEPAPTLTCWDALEAIRARVHAQWDDPSFRKAGIALPNLRQHIQAVLAITIDGEGTTGEAPDPLERFKGRPLAESQLTVRVQNLLRAANVTTLYHLMRLTVAEADAIPGTGKVTLAQIAAEQRRLAAV